MYQGNFTYKKLALAVMLASGLLVGCSDSDNINKSEPAAPPVAEAIENPVSLVFQSTDTGVLTNQDVTFTLKGDQVGFLFVQGAEEDATKATAASKTYTAKSGTVQVSRKDGASVNEFNLELHATSTGYFATGLNVRVPAKSEGVAGQEGASFDVFFTPLAPTNTETAVAAAKATISSDAGGAVGSDITIETPLPAPGSANAGALANAKVKMSIPGGTQLLNAKGEPVTGTITANVVHFSNEPNGNENNQSVLEAFPGGLEPDVILDTNGNADPALAGGGFISAGFTAIQLQNEVGDVVAQFDQPITLSFDVAADTINPDTGNKIQTGDTIPVWSYDETTGRWKTEGTGIVGAFNAANSTFTLVKQVTHLSYYNLDFWWAARCRANIKFEEVNGNPYNPKVIFTRAGGGWTKGIYIRGMDTHTFNNIPATGAGKFQVVSRSNFNQGLIQQVRDKDGNVLTINSDNSITHNFCELDGATVRIESPATRTLNVSLQSTCNDNDLTTAQPGIVEVYSQDLRRYFGSITPTADTAGSIRLAINNYRLKGTIYTEKFGTQQQDVNISITGDTSTTITFPIEVCGTATGTGSTGASGSTGD